MYYDRRRKVSWMKSVLLLYERLGSCSMLCIVNIMGKTTYGFQGHQVEFGCVYVWISCLTPQFFCCGSRLVTVPAGKYHYCLFHHSRTPFEHGRNSLFSVDFYGFGNKSDAFTFGFLYRFRFDVTFLYSIAFTGHHCIQAMQLSQFSPN